MGRERTKRKMKLKMKVKVKRRDLTEKKARVLCDFCGFSSSSGRCEESPHKQDDVSSMESQLKRLRLLTRRLTGKDLDGLSFAELQLLQTHLKQRLLFVKKRKMELEEDEQLHKQEKEAVDTDDRVLAPCQFSGSSSGVRQAPSMSKTQLAYERRQAESMETEFKRLWLLKERMCGGELVGVTPSELDSLEETVRCGLRSLHDHLFGPRLEHIAAQRRAERRHSGVSSRDT